MLASRWLWLFVAVLAAVVSGCATTTAPTGARIPRPASLQKAWEQLKGPRDETGVVSITDNARAWATRWELVTDARESIDLSAFIFDDDVFGFALLGALTERALAGVKVRMLIDGRGSFALGAPLFGRDYLQEMVETGKVDIHIYNPPLDQLAGALIKLDAVQVSAGSHNKILVVDRAVAIVGGRNVNSHYFASLAEDPGAVSDADVLIDGRNIVDAVDDVMVREFSSWRKDDVAADPVNLSSKRDELLLFAGAMDAWVRGRIVDDSDERMVDALEHAALARLDHVPADAVVQALRERLWALVGFRSVRGTVPTAPAPREVVDARVVATLSRARGVKRNAATDAVLRAIGGARREIVIQSPSFILSSQLLRAFEEASARGVAITVLTNSPISSDSMIAQSLFIDSWPELMLRIPTLRVFTARIPQMQHAKRAVFDDELTFVGTYNLDPFSTKMNSETVVACWSSSFASRTKAELLAVQAGMDEYRLARDKDGLPRRYPPDHERAGQLITAFGPRDQVPPEKIQAIQTVKGILLGVQNLWDFDVVVW